MYFLTSLTKWAKGDFWREASVKVERAPIKSDCTRIGRVDHWIARDIPILTAWMLMRKAHASTQKNSVESHHTGNLICNLIHNPTDYLKRLSLAKSKLCTNPSLRYMFLLNNSYFTEQVSELWRHHQRLKLTPECKKHMDSYLDVSWGHVLSCIPKSKFPEPLCRWINTSSLAKFESAFHQTYQAWKLWKVPDSRLRDVLRKAITKRVISGYCDHLNKHPRLEKLVGRERRSPEVLEEMLGELFEGWKLLEELNRVTNK